MGVVGEVLRLRLYVSTVLLSLSTNCCYWVTGFQVPRLYVSTVLLSSSCLCGCLISGFASPTPSSMTARKHPHRREPRETGA